MRRLDSFLRESSRINAVTLSTPLSPLLRPLNQHELMWPTPRLASLNRYALRDYTFQDGTFIPKGTFVTASLHSLHMSEKTYEDAEKFDPWRFVETGANGEVLEDNMVRQFTSTSAEYLAFGSGKHVWYAIPPLLLSSHLRDSNQLRCNVQPRTILRSERDQSDFVLLYPELRS